MLEPLDSALALGKQGLAVFPVNRDKSPACTGGCKAAGKDEAAIRHLWQRAPNASYVGVATGAPSDIDVLDIDKQHGGYNWYAEHGAKIPATRIYKTRSDGLHIWFRHKAGLKNSVSQIAPGVDVRTTGGSAIYWPAAGFPVLNNTLQLAEWPDWLYALASPPPRPTIAPVVEFPQGRGYTIAALRRGIETVANAPSGQRNHILNREAFSLLRFAKTGALTPDEILTPLAQAAMAAGLDRREIVSTLESAIRARGIA